MPETLRTLTVSNIPIEITGISTRFVTATFFAINAFTSSGTPIYNSGNIYLGINSGQLPIVLATGSYFNYNLNPPFVAENLFNFWINGQNGDGVYVIYY